MKQAGGRNLRRSAQVAMLALVLASHSAVEAQQSRAVARLKQVTGNVLVSQQSGLGTGSTAQPLANGTRVITTANATAVIAFDNGCEIELKANQRLEVDSGKPCAALLLQVQGIVPQVAVAPAGGLAWQALPEIAAVVGFAMIRRSRETQAVSPS